MGCHLTVKIHPEEKRLSPYNRFIRSLDSPLFNKKRGNPFHTTGGNVHSSPEKPIVENNGALFIGINKYKHWPHLNCAVQDATTLAQKFMSFGYQTTLLINEEATYTQILRQIEKCVSSYDKFVIGFFGHGISPADIGGMFIPVNAEQNTHAYNKIHATSLKTFSQRSKATSGLFILDFCYSGAFLKKAKKTRGASWSEMLEKESSRIVLTSGLSNQRVDDDNGRGNSPFTSALLSSLDACNSVVELYIHLRKLLTNTSNTSLSVPKMGRFPGCGGGDIFIRKKSSIKTKV